MSGTVPLAPARGPSGRAVAALIAGAFVVAASITLVFLGMRAVMEIGGACAEGGPYVPARPCPDGAGLAMFIGIPAWFLGAGLLMAGGSVGGRWTAAPLLAWSGLFGALGWNFLEYAFAYGGPEWGWLICGVVFEAMAIVPLLALLPLARLSPDRAAALERVRVRRSQRATGLRPAEPAGDVGARDDRPTETPLLFLDDGSWQGSSAAALPTTAPSAAADADVVADLERLAALRASGALSDEEFARAKDAVLDAASRETT